MIYLANAACAVSPRILNIIDAFYGGIVPAQEEIGDFLNRASGMEASADLINVS